ncbi:MAG TPA: HD domain-containing phosphohydrolase [Longimicrobium sp.]|nr:HD domain-containing phosphohydrolase [Longimicrobium sp.]
MTVDVQSLLTHATELERAGDWQKAAGTLHTVYETSLRERDIPLLLEAVVRLGHCHRLAGRRDLAADMLELAKVLGHLHGRPDIEGRAVNGMGVLMLDSGELQEAAALYREANALGRQAGDDVLVGETEQNLGILANIRGEVDEARVRYETALLHLERAGSVRGRISSLNNLGLLHLYQGQLDEADEHFERALRICEEVGDVVRAGIVHLNRTEMFLARGDLNRAREACDEGFEIFSRLSDELRQAEALKFYGMIYRESGKLHLAEIHLQRAIGLTSPAFPLLEAQAQREMARVLRMQGRNRQALEALNRSHALFTSLQARPDLADIDQRVAELEEDFLSLVRFWGESIEAKDRYTMGHCARVADYACRIAERAGLTERELVWFRMGAFLHDVGKTEVPEEILNKPGRLTDEERAIMERHTVIGDEMLAPVEFPWDIRPMVRSHHERWDGRGYPDGLAGDDIPLSARILRVADVFDALTTARSYRRPLTPDEALEIMRDDAGSFDPGLFVIFLELFPEFAPTAVEAAFAGTS